MNVDCKFVAYYRVSTARQGNSGLGLEAQKETVSRFLNNHADLIIAEYIERETGKGADALNKRPQLKAALETCRKYGAKLLIAKLDRLARNVHFISGLLEEAKGNGKQAVQFIACDIPEANELTIHMMAAFAEFEAKRISERTKDALKAAKARGVKLGVSGINNLKPNIEARKRVSAEFFEKVNGIFRGMINRGLSQRAMVKELNNVGVTTPKGGIWRLRQVQRILAKINDMNQSVH